MSTYLFLLLRVLYPSLFPLYFHLCSTYKYYILYTSLTICYSVHAITEGDTNSLEDRFHLRITEKGLWGDTRRRVSMKRQAKTILVVHRDLHKAPCQKYGHLHVNSAGMGLMCSFYLSVLHKALKWPAKADGQNLPSLPSLHAFLCFPYLYRFLTTRFGYLLLCTLHMCPWFIFIHYHNSSFCYTRRILKKIR